VVHSTIYLLLTFHEIHSEILSYSVDKQTNSSKNTTGPKVGKVMKQADLCISSDTEKFNINISYKAQSVPSQGIWQGNKIGLHINNKKA